MARGSRTEQQSPESSNWAVENGRPFSLGVNDAGGLAAQRAAPFLALGQGRLTLSRKEISFPLSKFLAENTCSMQTSSEGRSLHEEMRTDAGHVV